MDLEAFEKNELPKIKENWHYDPVVGDAPMLKLVEAFKQAMLENIQKYHALEALKSAFIYLDKENKNLDKRLKLERKRCAKISRNEIHVEDLCDRYYVGWGDAAEEITKKIESGK